MHILTPSTYLREVIIMSKDKAIYVIIGRTLGIGDEMVNQLVSENNIVHVAYRQTGLDVSN